MKPQVKYGLIVGGIGLVLNICVATVMGICGPGVSLVVGAVAGFLAIQQAEPITKGDGARLGAVTGLIAGAVVLVGQMLGGVGALILVQQSGMEMPFGSVPSPSADSSQQLIYYASGLGTGLCFGVVGIILAALAGAAAGYLATSES